MKLEEKKLTTQRYYDRNVADWAKKRSNLDYCREDFTNLEISFRVEKFWI
jgi:hypothetical protein